jgi:hypothetical protein
MATKTSSSSRCKTPFRDWSGAWNFVPTGGYPPRERCQAVATEAERQAAAKLIQRYRSQEEVSATHNIEAMSRELAQMEAVSRRAHGGLDGELLRRKITAANHGTYLGAEEELAKLRLEAIELAKGYLKRLVQTFNEALNASAAEAEKRIESENLPIINGDEWLLHDDGVCAALWFRRTKAQQVLDQLEPSTSIGVCQYFLTSEAGVPFAWPQ